MKRVSKIILYDKKSGKVLLQLRENNPEIAYPNTWTLFGGRIEKSETPEDAVKRELKEELEGLKISNIQKLFTKNRSQNGLEVEDNIFYAELESKISEMKLLEGQDMKLFSKEELDSGDVFVPFKNYIKELLNWD